MSRQQGSEQKVFVEYRETLIYDLPVCYNAIESFVMDQPFPGDNPWSFLPIPLR
jgi:hypothetical protein